ncbi:MAG: hypothetical protein WAV95_03040 [Azonexus sp.]
MRGHTQRAEIAQWQKHFFVLSQNKHQKLTDDDYPEYFASQMRAEPTAPSGIKQVTLIRDGGNMEKTSLEQRRYQRQEPQQQPQQSVIFPANMGSASARASKASPRTLMHVLAIAQARKQSGQL